MGRFVQGLGVLFAIGAAASFAFPPGAPRAYAISFVSPGNDPLTAVKAEAEPHLVSSDTNTPTKWTFTNNAREDVQFEMHESGGCHFRFTPPHADKPCHSQLLTIGKNAGTRIVTAHVLRQNESDCRDPNTPCEAFVNATLITVNTPVKVDPKLQIEDGLKVSPALHNLRYLLGGLAFICLGGPALVDFTRRRRRNQGD